LPALLSAGFAIALYAVTLGGGYIYDDRFVVRDDPRVHDPRQWGRLWTTDYFDGGIDNLYRPLVSTSYAIQWWLHGDRPWIFHLVNILLHATACAAIAEFTRRTLSPAPGGEGDFARGGSLDIANDSPPHRKSKILLECPETKSAVNLAALTAGLLFAAHPIHVEAVANIVGRAELGCTTCIFTGLVVLTRSPLTIRRVCCVVAIGVIGLLCKEQGILQPLLWFLLGVLVLRWPWRRSESNPVNRPLQTFLLTTCWIWAGYLILREHFLKFEWERSGLDPTIQPLVRSVGFDRILMPVVLFGRYIALLFWPAHLSMDYGAGVIGSSTHPGDPYLWTGVIALGIWIAAMAASARSIIRQQTDKLYCTDRLILFCLLGFAVTYGVVGNILTLIGTIFAERLMYLPSAFLLIILAALSIKLPRSLRVGLTLAILMLASIRTVTAAQQWNHPLELYKASLAAQPASIQAHLLLADEYHLRNDHAKADEVYDQLCRQYPKYWRVWQYRCEEALRAGDFPAADRYYARAIQLDHNPVLADLGSRLTEAKASASKRSD
jgi:hypothetical protein